MSGAGTVTVDEQMLAGLRARAEAGESFRLAVARRVGVGDDTAHTIVLDALDEALDEGTLPPPGPPEGVELVESGMLAQLRSDAEAGRRHRDRSLVEAAVSDGRIPPASRGTWLTLLDTDPNAEQVLAGLHPGTIPLTEIGYGADVHHVEDAAV